MCRVLQDCGSPLYQPFVDKKCLALLSYLSDIFGRLNELNSSVQGPNVNFFRFFDSVSALMKKMLL